MAVSKAPILCMVGLWATSGTIDAVSRWREFAGGSIGLVNTALITVGSTMILLYQRKCMVDRSEKIKDIAAGVVKPAWKEENFSREMHQYVKDLRDSRDEMARQRDEIAARIEDIRKQGEARAAELARQRDEVAAIADRLTGEISVLRRHMGEFPVAVVPIAITPNSPPAAEI